MDIRRANPTDIPALGRLLAQVLTVHHSGRPDIFKSNVRKYSDEQLAEIICDDTRPIFVGVDETGEVLGYAFCVFQKTEGDNVLQDHRALYIDDICVDETARHRQVGKQLCEFVVNFAKEQGFYHVTLRVWECNPGARAFYEAMGFVPYATNMERIIGG